MEPVLVTGVTGYVGTRLVPALLAEGSSVRVLVRDAAKVAARGWRAEVEVVEGDASDRRAVAQALEGVGVAYYLLHSMDGGGDFGERDRALAQGFAEAARDAGVHRLVYLSGLHPEGDLSDHLGSRTEVGEVLASTGVPTVVLQAGMVLGAGSASYEMLQDIAERLPAVVAPTWLGNRIQPIAVRDAVRLLIAAGLSPDLPSRPYDVGMPEVLTYRDMIQRYAALAGLGTVPVGLLPGPPPSMVSSLVGVLTDVPTGVAQPLVESLSHDVVCREDDIYDLVGIEQESLLRFDDAVTAVLAQDRSLGLPEPGEADPAWLTTADADWAG